MFGVAVLTCCFGFAGDEPTSEKPTKTGSRFDVRQAVRWLIGKNRAASPLAVEPASTQPAEDLSDARVELRCRTNVFSDPEIRASGIKVRVVEGLAYLDGEVASRWHRHRAEQLAQRTPGVLRVENQLRLTEPAVSPAQLESAVLAAPAEVQASAATTPASAVVVGRPKTLPADSGEPSVTTYTIRRSSGEGSDLRPAAVKTEATKPPSKPSAGKLVPWNQQPAGPGWLDSIGFTQPIAKSKPATLPKLSTPLDYSIQKAIEKSGDASIAFERKGSTVTLRGKSPAKTMLSLAQEIGTISGVGTVAIAADEPSNP